MDEVCSILRAGANIVTSAEFLGGHVASAPTSAAIEAAAAAGQASLFGSGMNPGFLDVLAGLAAGASLGVRHLYATESVDVSLYAGDGNMDALGWGRDPADPGLAGEVGGSHRGVRRRPRGPGPASSASTTTSPAARWTSPRPPRTSTCPGRPIPAGTVAGLDVRWEALRDGEPLIELHQRWVMGSAIEPRWPVEHGWLIKVTGDPHIRIKLDVWPDTDDLGSLTPDDIHNIGMRLTGVPLVNAIPHVCAAAPGIRTYADLPTISTNLAATPPAPEQP